MANVRSSQPQNQTTSQTKATSRVLEGQASHALSYDRTDAIGLSLEKDQSGSKKASGLEMDEAIATAGRAGERSITIEKFWVAVDGNLPAGFNVATLAGNGLEVVMEQRSYRKTYVGTGALKTGLTPIAPIGTKGRILVKDTTTGETLEQPWNWHLLHPGLFSGLWAFLKNLFWKG